MANKCKYCNVYIKDDTNNCPLCGGVIEADEPGENSYPNIYRKTRAVNILFKIVLLITICAGSVCITLNIHDQSGLAWSVIVVGSCLFVLLFVALFLRDKGYRFRVFMSVLYAVALVFTIDYVIGFEKWSINYALPGAVLFLDFVLVLLMIINRRSWQSYLMLQALMVVLSAIPFILGETGVITAPLLSEISFGLTILLFVAVVIIGGGPAYTELRRRFHIR